MNHISNMWTLKWWESEANNENERKILGSCEWFLNFVWEYPVSGHIFLNVRHFPQGTSPLTPEKYQYHQISPSPYARLITSKHILNHQWFYTANSNIYSQYLINHQWLYTANYNISSQSLINHQWFYSANPNGSTLPIPIFQIKNKLLLRKLTPDKLYEVR